MGFKGVLEYVRMGKEKMGRWKKVERSKIGGKKNGKRKKHNT